MNYPHLYLKIVMFVVSILTYSTYNLASGKCLPGSDAYHSYGKYCGACWTAGKWTTNWKQSYGEKYGTDLNNKTAWPDGKDKIDACCRKHDNCYAIAGNGSKTGCDTALCNCSNKVKNGSACSLLNSNYSFKECAEANSVSNALCLKSQADVVNY